MPRPGIMIYFDMLGPIRVLPDADKGKLLVAMLEYGQTGKTPAFDEMLALAWEFVRPKIDRDSEEYNRTVLKRQYATFCRDRKKKGEPEISFEEWLQTIGNQSYQDISNDIKWYPTTTTTPSTNTNTNTNTATAAAASTTDFAMLEDDELCTKSLTAEDFAAAAAERKVKVMNGELGKSVVFLSDEQVEDLLEKMGLDAFDHYVEKLASFILDKGARVKSHYETILRWWREDGRLEA